MNISSLRVEFKPWLQTPKFPGLNLTASLKISRNNNGSKTGFSLVKTEFLVLY